MHSMTADHFKEEDVSANHPYRGRALAVAAAIGASVLALTACAPSGGNESGDAGEFTLLTIAENATIRDELATLAEGVCSAENEAMPLSSETFAQSDVVQRITLLASQDALPVMFTAGTAMVRPDGDLGAGGLVLNYEDALTELGVWDNVLPAAVSTIEGVYGHMVSLPFQYNVEGFFYNKEIFAELGLEVPTNYDELLAVLDAAEQAGYLPLAQPGAEGWTLTRLLGNYIFRSVGPDAMERIQSGDAKLTDPEYVAGAQALADLGAAGYLGEGATSREPDAAYSAFLSGEAAVIYQPSSFLAQVYDESLNQIGADSVGVFPFPAVAGGAGAADQWPANAGTATAIAAEAYTPEVGAWLSCIAENYGSSVMENQGVLSGFRLNTEVDIPGLTAELQQSVSEADQTVLWFEARFDAKTDSDSRTNVALLATGQMSPEEYMSILQADLDQAQ